jgi:tRNA-specific adenosine deaminase 2
MILAQEEYFKKIQDSPRSFWKDVTLYVTIEPCVMCASALRQLGMEMEMEKPSCKESNNGQCSMQIGM